MTLQCTLEVGTIEAACLRIEISGGQGVGKRTVKNDFFLFSLNN